MRNIQAEGIISERIRDSREYLELSVDELAEAAGISLQEMIDLEAGNTPVSATLLSRIAKAVGRGMEYFTGDVPARTAAERTEFLARAAETLSEQDIGELQRFASYLRSRSQSAEV